MLSKGIRKCLARAIIIDRATPGSISVIGRVARERTEENYRFASRLVGGKAVLDIGGGAGIGHDLLLAGGAASILPLEEIDEKFSTAYDEPGLRAFLKNRFGTEPKLYVQQPVPVSHSLSDTLRFWLIPLIWPLRRHPVVPRTPGTEGMYVYAVVNKSD